MARPTIVYRVSDVVLIPPCLPTGPIRAVLARKVGEPAGKEFIEPVTGGSVVLRSLSAGAYDIWYLADANRRPTQHQSCDRRILIEIQDPNAANVLASDQPSAAKSVSPTTNVADPAVRNHMDRGWNLLRRGACYTAHREFLAALMEIVGQTSNVDDPESTEQRLREFLSRDCDCDIASDSGRSMLASASNALSKSFVGRSDAAQALYGLGKSYRMMARTGQPRVHSADHRAVLCYMAASQVDPRHAASRNELGVQYFNAGLVSQAADCFRDAADLTRDPAPAYNLGRCREAQGRRYEAMLAHERALWSDDHFLPALVEYCRLRTLADAPAMYPEQASDLIGRLSEIINQRGIHTEDGLWASLLLSQLSDLPKEELRNRSSIASRRRLPTEGRLHALAIESPSTNGKTQLLHPVSRIPTSEPRISDSSVLKVSSLPTNAGANCAVALPPRGNTGLTTEKDSGSAMRGHGTTADKRSNSTEGANP